MTASCGGDKGDEPDEPGKNEEVVTRVQDRDDMIFLQDGKLVEANTAFSTLLLHQALTESNWKRDYGILYDNKHISGIFDLSDAALPLMLMTDQTAMFPYSSKRPYTLSGKTMSNVLEYRNAASYTQSENRWTRMVATGDGRCYGVELLDERNVGALTGWISYTWSKSLRKFDRPGQEIDDGREFYTVATTLPSTWKPRVSPGSHRNAPLRQRSRSPA